jgi:hypothetical protein
MKTQCFEYQLLVSGVHELSFLASNKIIAQYMGAISAK